MNESRLSPFLLSPRGIAIIGASGDVTRFGGQTVRALNTSGYSGGVYPVNPKYPEIDGRRCLASVAEIDGPCDLAVIALPAAHVARAIEQCARRGIGYAVVLGGGFREIGAEGQRLERQMLEAARGGGVRLIGPNCIGLVNVHDHVIAAFGSLTRPPKLQPGGVSVAVQSGGFGMSVVIQAAMAGVGFRHVVATGSESDITMPELLDHYVDDPHTTAMFAYIEGVADGRALMAALERALDAGKPVVVWKAGRTGQGARAAASHTANLTSSYAVYRAALRQCGAIEVSSAEQVVDFLLTQAGRGAPTRCAAGRHVAVVTNTGGSAVVFADAADEAELKLVTLGEATQSRLRGLLPPLAAVGNPVDTTAGYPRPEHEASLREAFETLLADDDVHQLCVLFGTIMGPSFALEARVLGEAAVKHAKPVVAVSAVPASVSSVGHEHFSAAGIPLLSSPNRAAQVMGQLADLAQARARRRSALERSLRESADHAALNPAQTSASPTSYRRSGPVAGATPSRTSHPTHTHPSAPTPGQWSTPPSAPTSERASSWGLASPLPAGDVTLDELEGKALLRAAGIPVTDDVAISLDAPVLRGGTRGRTPGAAIQFPVALKLLSRDVPHKSDIGGVRLGVRNEEELAEAARGILDCARAAAPLARIEGLLACPMVEEGLEVIVGVIDDESFGPVVVLGLGGVFAETLGDVVMRIAPFGQDEADRMIGELRGAALFAGQRGRPPADRSALAAALSRVSELAGSLRGRLRELDINPLVVKAQGDGVVALDALVVLRSA